MSSQVTGKLRSKGRRVDFNLPYITFEENGIHFVYSPALDITGCGKSIEEAQASFEETLAQFLDYTTRKKTLAIQLKKLGWRITRKTLKSPSLTDLLLDNKYLVEIFEVKSYSKFDKTISIPALV